MTAWERLTGVFIYPFTDSALNATIWMGSIGGLIANTVFLLLALDVFRSGSMRRRSVYMAFLFVGLAYLIVIASLILTNFLYFAIFGILYNDALSIIFAVLPQIFIYLPVIAASTSLVRGGKWEGKNLNLSRAAIFLYVGANILRLIISIPLILQAVMGPLAYLSRWVQWMSLANGLMSVPYWISLLSIGFLLNREQKQKTKEQPTGESPADIGSSIRS